MKVIAGNGGLQLDTMQLDTNRRTLQRRVEIQITPTFSELDAGQERIKHYLSERFAEREEPGEKAEGDNILIDIAILGVGGEGFQASRARDHSRIYPIRIYHATVLLGPLYTRDVDHTPCPLCLERRWLALRSREEQETLNTLQQAFIFGANPRLLPSALEMIWIVIAEVLSQHNPAKHPTESRHLYALNLDSLNLARHELIADSSCLFCARSEPDKPAVFQLSSRPKRGPLDYRLVKPQEYGLPELGYVNPVCGMLGSASAIDHYHTVTAPVSGKFLMKNGTDFYDVWWGGHTTNFRTSKYVGQLEGLERYCGHWARSREIAVVDSYKNLGTEALDPRTCGLYQPALYEENPHFQRFSEDRKLSWIWGYSLGGKRPILVPEPLVYYGGRTTKKDGPFVYDNSNGCAIGSCLEEAIFYGLLELIERDNFLLCWYAKLAPPRIDPWSSRNPSTLRLLDRIERLGYDAHFLDTRLDTEIPTITAVLVNRKDEIGKLVLAAGVGLDPEDAIRSALCEVSAYVASISWRVQKRLEEMREAAKDFTKILLLDQHPLLHALPEMAEHSAFLLQNPLLRSVEDTYESYRAAHAPNADLLDDLRYCLDVIFKLGMDVIVVDQTSPEVEEVGLKVARVIVPGLLPIDFGWGMQRVYSLPRLRTVPRTAGFLDKDFDPQLLNTTPHPFP